MNMIQAETIKVQDIYFLNMKKRNNLSFDLLIQQ